MHPGIRSVWIPAIMATFFACNSENKISDSETEGQTGAASIRLPAMPSNYLAKTSAKAKALFSLSITGPSMQAIHKVWDLDSDTGMTFTIGGIPVGNARLFSGRLLKISSKGDTLETHSGSVSSRIIADSIMPLLMVLKRSGLGAANLCVEVEGWVTETDCEDVVPAPIHLTGCYSLLLMGQDSLGHPTPPEMASLQLQQYDTLLHAVLKWPSGRMDTANGVLNDHQVFIIGAWSSTDTSVYNGTFYLKAAVSPNRMFSGDLRLIGEAFSASASGVPGSCDSSDTDPRACFSTARVLRGDTTDNGRLVLRSNSLGTWGYFQWSGIYYRAYPITDTFSDFDKAELSLPMSDWESPNAVSNYHIRFLPKAMAEGSIYAGYADTALVGNWRATRSTCTAQEPI